MSLDFKKSQKTQLDNFQRKEEFFRKTNYADNENSRTGNIGKILHSWRAPQFEVYEKSGHWYIIAALFILALITYALFTDSPIMAITFILIGIMGYIYSQKNPEIINFSITERGVLADKELYLYENIKSFWIFYEHDHNIKILSLRTKASVFPFVHIPLRNENPVKLREFLIENIPEIKQELSMIDTLERVLHI